MAQLCQILPVSWSRLLVCPMSISSSPGRLGPSNACWGLVRHLFQKALALTSPRIRPVRRHALRKCGIAGDARDPWEVLQPWDAPGAGNARPLSDHVGLIVEPTLMVHCAQRVGVCVEPIQRWKPKLVQIVRLRSVF